MFRLFSRTFWFICFATVTVAGAFRAGDITIPSSLNPQSRVLGRDRSVGEGARSDTAQMVLLGLGLNYVGWWIGKRKA